MNNEFLTEQSLGIFLKDMFKTDFVHDKVLVGRFRPDYRNDELHLIVEFDGYAHYTSSTNILRDRVKDAEELKLGYKIVRWPYFVQMSQLSAKHFLGIDYDVKQTYDDGFIDSKCICPADFCELGIEKFAYEFKTLPEKIQNSIVRSLERKITKSRYGMYEIVSKSLNNNLFNFAQVKNIL